MAARATTRKRQPAKFDRCVKAVKKRGGAKNAYAVCRAAGAFNPAGYRGMSVAKLEQIRPHVAVLTVDNDWLVRDRGRKELERVDHALELARKREGAKTRPNSVTWESDDASLIQQAQTSRSAEELARLRNYAVSHRDAKLKAAVDKRAAQLRIKPAELKWNPGKTWWVIEWTLKGVRQRPGLLSGDSRDQVERDWQALHPSGAVQSVVPRGKKNPASASAEVFEEFHGYKPKEVVKVTARRHHHEHLAAAGDLVGLCVVSLKGDERTIEGLGDAILAFNEAKNQLFIQGGDQRMTWNELKKFGATEEHELQTLGQLKAVGYFTNKKHLGKEGGEAVYSHTFKTTNEFGRHITVKIARYPDLIYRVLDEQFEISGGSYTILREGIDK